MTPNDQMEKVAVNSSKVAAKFGAYVSYFVPSMNKAYKTTEV